MKIEQLFTRETSNKPVRLHIADEWIDALGTDSDEFRKAKIEAQRLIASGKLKVEDFEPFLVASLIVGWSFEDDCSFDNRLKLMQNTPSLCEAIDRKASEQSNFIKLALASSSNGADAASGNGATSTKAKSSPAKRTGTK